MERSVELSTGDLRRSVEFDETAHGRNRAYFSHVARAGGSAVVAGALWETPAFAVLPYPVGCAKGIFECCMSLPSLKGDLRRQAAEP